MIIIAVQRAGVCYNNGIINDLDMIAVHRAPVPRVRGAAQCRHRRLRDERGHQGAAQGEPQGEHEHLWGGEAAHLPDLECAATRGLLTRMVFRFFFRTSVATLSGCSSIYLFVDE